MLYRRVESVEFLQPCGANRGRDKPIALEVKWSLWCKCEECEKRFNDLTTILADAIKHGPLKFEDKR